MATCITRSPDDMLLACGTVSGDVYLYDCITQLLVDSYQGHACAIKDVKFLPHTRAVASCGIDKICLYDINKRSVFRELQHRQCMFSQIAIEAQGEVLAAVDEEDTVHIFDLQSGRHVQEFRPHESHISQISFNHNESG